MAFDPDKYLAKTSTPTGFDPDAYLATAPKKSAAMSGIRGGVQGLLMNFADEGAGAMGVAGESVMGAYRKLMHGDSQMDDLGDIYREYRDAYRRDDQDYQRDNPKSFTAGEVGGGIAGSFIPGLGVTKGNQLLQAAKLGLLGGAGSSEADLTQGDVGGVVKDAAISGGLSAGLTGGLGLLGKTPKLLKGKAEKLAVSATGATRNQAEKFAPNAGRELLDNKLVRAFDSPASIAKRAQGVMDDQGKVISNALEAADASGVQVDPATVLSQVDEAIKKLKAKGAGHADQVRAMEKIKEDLAESLGNSPVALSVLEQQKRSFGKNTNWADPDKALAKKGIYRTLRDSVETNLSNAIPEQGEALKSGKKMWGLLDPIQEAAERRALQLEQSPKGGLLDVVTGLGAAGAAASGSGDDDYKTLGTIALLAALGRRVAAPRTSSTLAVGADKLSKLAKPLGLLDKEAVRKNAARVIPALINSARN